MNVTEALSEAKKWEKLGTAKGKAGDTIVALAKALRGAMGVVDSSRATCYCDFCELAKMDMRPDESKPEDEENSFWCDGGRELKDSIAKFDQIMKGGA